MLCFQLCLLAPCVAVAASENITETHGAQRASIAVSRQIARDVRPERRHADRLLLVTFKSDMTETDIDRACSEHGVAHSGRIGCKGGFSRIVASRGRDISKVCASLLASGIATTAEPDFIVASQASISDPLIMEQWALEVIHASSAWPRVENGSDVVVAILDSGFEMDNPDLAGRIVGGYDFIDGDTSPEDGFGHGTYVAGLIGAVQGNGVGIAGVARKVRLMPVRVLNDYGAGLSSNLAEGIVWAADHGAQIINISLGSYDRSAVVEEAIAYAAAKGCLIVGAAGNVNNSRPMYPAAFDQVISVTGVDRELRAAGMASGSTIDISAPAVDVIGPALNGGYQRRSGTSAATAHVSGVISLAISARPDLAASQIRSIIESSALDVESPGKDERTGEGVIQAERAVILALSQRDTSYHDLALVGWRILGWRADSVQIDAMLGFRVANLGTRDAAEATLFIRSLSGDKPISIPFLKPEQSAEIVAAIILPSSADSYSVKAQLVLEDDRYSQNDVLMANVKAQHDTEGTIVALYKEETHRVLTDEAIQLVQASDVNDLKYTQIYANQGLKNQILDGSEAEDAGTEFFLFLPHPKVRYSRHFYNPDSGSTGPGLVISGLGQIADTRDNAYQWGLGSSKSFGQENDPTNPDSNDRGFRQAIEEYGRGNLDSAYLCLGHLSHLIEDMAQPDHTHMRAHYKNRYEPWAAEQQQHDQIRNLVSPPNAGGLTPISGNKFLDFMDSMSKKSRHDFIAGEDMTENIAPPNATTKQWEVIVDSASAAFKDLIPKAVEHVAGFMKLFHDIVNQVGGLNVC